ncbi:MAG TPA: Dabb family protein [Ktedonobacteraceae bacterium]|jgi:quinol monooxygenase YgiN
MITHIVLLQPKPETTREELEEVLERVKALKGQVPGLLTVQAGANRHNAHQGYTYGFVMQFENEEHLRAYSPHPAHKAVSPDLRRLCTALLNFDLPQA